MLDLNRYRPLITELCQSLGVRQLDLVGSAARDDFQPDSSDIDVLIEFEGNQALFDRYFDLKNGLERIFGRKVDIIQSGAVKNPYLLATLQECRMKIYEA